MVVYLSDHAWEWEARLFGHEKAQLDKKHCTIVSDLAWLMPGADRLRSRRCCIVCARLAHDLTSNGTMKTEAPAVSAKHSSRTATVCTHNEIVLFQ